MPSIFFVTIITLIKSIHTSSNNNTEERYLPSVIFISIICLLIILQAICLVYIIIKLNRLHKNMDIRNLEETIKNLLETSFNKCIQIYFTTLSRLTYKGESRRQKNIVLPRYRVIIQNIKQEKCLINKETDSDTKSYHENKKGKLEINSEETRTIHYEDYNYLSNEDTLLLLTMYVHKVEENFYKTFEELHVLLELSTPCHFVPMNSRVMYSVITQELKYHIRGIKQL